MPKRIIDVLHASDARDYRAGDVIVEPLTTSIGGASRFWIATAGKNGLGLVPALRCW